jgi:hypothetical protein
MPAPFPDVKDTKGMIPRGKLSYGRASSFNSPYSVETFTRGKMMSGDYDEWIRRGSKLEDLTWLAQEYGQFFKWLDGKVYPTEHYPVRPLNRRLLLTIPSTNEGATK